MKSILMLFVLVINLLFNGQQETIISKDFELSYEDESLKVFTKTKIKPQFIEYKAELILLNVKPNDVLSILKNYKDYPSWMYNCISAQEIERSKNTIYVYQISKFSWPFQNRDVILKSSVEEFNDKIVINYESTRNKEKLKNKFVRIDECNGKWIIEKLNNKTKITLYGSFNPKLKLLYKNLNKKYAIKIPYTTLKALEKKLIIN